MVSLYRAWAAWRGMGVPGAPDALVQAGGVRFAAHARLLAAHSGYFKSVLSRPWNLTHGGAFPSSSNSEELRSFEETAAKSTETGNYESSFERERREFDSRYHDARGEHLGQIPSEDNVVYVPNISAQQFWPLLAYMYTGYLELTPENIYQVLLATHLLHMPRALELCRNFLAQGATAPLPAPATTVVKPIPSRKLPTFLPTTAYRPMYAESAVPFLGTQYETPFKPPLILQNRLSTGEGLDVDKSEDVNVENTAKDDGVIGATQASHSPTRIEKATENEECDKSKEDENIRKTSPTFHSAINLIKARKPKAISKINVPEKRAEIPKSSSGICNTFKEKPDMKNSSQGDDKVVVDVACCDGPVRFHRVLNSAYKGNGTDSVRAAADSSDSDDSYIEIEEDSRSQNNTPYDNCNAFSKSLQKQMNENIRTMTTKHNENHPNFIAGEDLQKSDANDPDASNSDVSSKCQQDTIYTCVYCNHTFKSQYCYQKHARRHINPVSIDAVNQGAFDISEGCCKVRKLPGSKTAVVAAGPKREVRLLDMNVQYYPCKTCGSKFPSYYFVHKHRKMCHAEELENGPEIGKPGAAAEKKRKLSSSATGSREDNVVSDNDGGTSNKTEIQNLVDK